MLGFIHFFFHFFFFDDSTSSRLIGKGKKHKIEKIEFFKFYFIKRFRKSKCHSSQLYLTAKYISFPVFQSRKSEVMCTMSCTNNGFLLSPSTFLFSFDTSTKMSFYRYAHFVSVVSCSQSCFLFRFFFPLLCLLFLLRKTI